MGLKTGVRDWFIRRKLDNQAKEKTMIGKIWTWLDGKKTLISAIVLVLSVTADQLSVILPSLLEPSVAARYLGYVGLAIGIVHKAFKFVYKTDAPKG